MHENMIELGPMVRLLQVLGLLREGRISASERDFHQEVLASRDRLEAPGREHDRYSRLSVTVRASGSEVIMQYT